MRPGELCPLAGAEIDRTRLPWRYEVTAHNKALHKDVRRVVFFGPKARAILEPLLAAAGDGPLFVLPPYREGAKAGPPSVQFYCRAVAAACKAAGVAAWSPNQLERGRREQAAVAERLDGVPEEKWGGGFGLHYRPAFVGLMFDYRELSVPVAAASVVPDTDDVEQVGRCTTGRPGGGCGRGAGCRSPTERP
jgi:hypothetical protein